MKKIPNRIWSSTNQNYLLLYISCLFNRFGYSPFKIDDVGLNLYSFNNLQRPKTLVVHKIEVIATRIVDKKEYANRIWSSTIRIIHSLITQLVRGKFKESNFKCI